MHIPEGMPHSAENFDRYRFSLAVIDDRLIDAGKSITAQYIDSALARIR